MNFSYSQISPGKVALILASGPPARIVDVRELWEYTRCHIPQALLMPMGEFVERCQAELAPSEEIILICEHGVRSENAAQYLASLGYERVSTMTGGMADYTGATEKGV